MSNYRNLPFFVFKAFNNNGKEIRVYGLIGAGERLSTIADYDELFGDGDDFTWQFLDGCEHPSPEQIERLFNRSTIHANIKRDFFQNYQLKESTVKFWANNYSAATIRDLLAEICGNVLPEFVEPCHETPRFWAIRLFDKMDDLFGEYKQTNCQRCKTLFSYKPQVFAGGFPANCNDCFGRK